jgi:A/G-specific adenine glycosylase
VSEFCCQQTQVARASDVYERFCERFDTPRSCARAPLRDVLDIWRGLGYYRRARNLHQAAGVIVEQHGGRVPDDIGSLVALPGVGAYTARAVLAFSFERDVAVVDTNVRRILSRAVANRALSVAEAQRIADDLVSPGTGWRHNQALLDLGALHCTAAPNCSGCPLRPACAWRRSGEGADPAASPLGAGSRRAFAGSDREGRGRILAAVLDGPVQARQLARVSGWPDDPARALRVATEMAVEGLLEAGRDRFSAPRTTASGGT